MMVHPGPFDDLTPPLGLGARGDLTYAEMIHDPHMVEIYRRNAMLFGRRFRNPVTGPRPSWPFMASSDMGNVSLEIPSIHPHIGINCTAALHEPEFASACNTTIADRAIEDGSLALAFTVVDVALDPGARSRLLSNRRSDDYRSERT